MKTKLTLSGLVLLLILLAGGVSAWRSQGPRADPGELRLVVKALPGTLDWSRSSSPSDVNYPVILAVMRGLTRLDERGEAQPDLARSWEVAVTREARPRMILTFHLCDTTWSDGKTPLEARDFVVGWRRAALGADGGEMAEVERVEALDPRTLRVTLNAPHREFLQRLAQVYVFYPAPSRDLEGLDEAGIRAYFDEPRGGHPKVLGRYRPERWDHLRGLLRLVRNRFANPLPSAPERVTFYQSALESVLYARDKADFLQVQDPRDIWFPAPDLQHRPLLSTVWLGFDTERVPLALRQAIFHGLDRSRLMAGVLPGARVAFGLLPHDMNLPGAVGPREAPGFPAFDLPLARRDLAAGCPKPLPRLLLLVPKESLVPGEALGRGIQQQLKELGLEVEIIASAQFAQDLETLRPHLFIRRTGADYNHPNSFFVPQTRTGSNGARWKDLEGGRPMAELEALLGAGVAEGDPERLRSCYTRAQELLLSRWTVLVPLYYPDRYFRRKPWVGGLTFDACNTLDLRALTLGSR